jgi:hypothetical protein
MAEADLLCELLCETGTISEVMLCSKIQKTAFRFLTCKGPGCFAAAATMMVQALPLPTDYYLLNL